MTKQEIGSKCVTAMAGLYSLSRNVKEMALNNEPGGEELMDIALEAMRKINEVIERHGK